MAMVMQHSHVKPEQRFTRQRPCPVCGGYRELAPGRGERCYGFISDDSEWAICTREEHAGPLPHNGAGFSHHLIGVCGCGVTHAIPAAPVPSSSLPSPSPRRRSRPSETLGILEHVYVYQDTDGRPVHRTLRFRNPKTFRQQRYDRGMWKKGVMGFCDLVLYRLPELLATHPSEPVFLPEGEKDCDQLAAAGLVATTNPCGALTWRDQFTDWLRGRHVVILEDNDDQGQRRTERLVAALGPVCRLDLVHFRGMPRGYDISDWLASGTVEQLLAGLRDDG